MIGARASALSDASTFGQLLARSALPANEARILLAHATQRTRVELITAANEEVAPAAIERFRELCQRREHGEPIAYLVGEREFYGRAFQVSPSVLIPRPETELLIEVALAWPGAGAGAGARGPLRILDLGTGSGILAITLALECNGARITAAERSTEALAIARANGRRHAARVCWVESDWYCALEGERFDLIVANPPYIAAGDPHLQQGDLRFEPALALASGPSGHEALNAIISGAARHLRPGGALLLEHGYDQAGWVQGRLVQTGMTGVRSWKDLAGIDRVTAGQAPASA